MILQREVFEQSIRTDYLITCVLVSAGCRVSGPGYSLLQCPGTGGAEPVSFPKLHFRSASCGAVEVGLPNEMLAKMFHLVTPFIPGLSCRCQFLRSDSLTSTSSHDAMP